MPLIDWNTAHRSGHGVMTAFVGWMRKDRWFTDMDGASRSWSVYSQIEAGRYGTSILGVINGVLPRFGIVHVAMVTDAGEPIPPYFGLRRRWWDL